MTKCAMPAHGREGPVWLSCFIKGKYFDSCKFHASERNHFCIDCAAGPLCPFGLLEHGHHRTLQVRRASHFDAVRVVDIQKLVNIVQIQTYIINSAKIVFLLPRPQQKTAKEASKACKSCGRNLADPVLYCSIGCKLIGVRKYPSNVDLSLTLEGKEGQYFPVMDDQEAMAASSPGSFCEDWPLNPVFKRYDGKDGNAPMRKLHKLIFDERWGDNKRNCDEMPGLHSYSLEQTDCSDSPFAPSTPQSRESGNMRGQHKRKGTPHRAPFT